MERKVPQDEYINSYKQDHTRAGWSARNALEAAKVIDADANAPDIPPEIISSLEQLYEMCLEHTKMQQTFKRAEKQKKAGNPKAAEADYGLDRNYSSFVGKVKDEIALYGADSARGKAAQKMLDGPLSPPVHSVTNVYREEQESTMGTIIDDLDQNFANEIKVCELEAHFQVLKDDFAHFVELMSYAHDPDAPSKDAIKVHKADIETKMNECIWRVGGAYPTASEHDLKMRSMLLGPFSIQNDKLAEFYKRRGGGEPPQVDIETGEDETEEPVVEA